MEKKKNNSIFASVLKGILNVLDFIVTLFFSIFLYVYYAFYYIFEFIYNYFLKYVLKYTIGEVFLIIKSALHGIFGFLDSIFSIIPNSIKKKQKNASGQRNDSIGLIKQFFETLPGKIKKYFEDKINNSAIVKNRRNRKERELEILYIDKNGQDAQRTEEKHAYQYLARNAEGKLIKGYFSALSKLDVLSYLLDGGFEVYEIKTSWLIDFLHGESSFIKMKMKKKDLVFWLAQLSTYIKSGITLTEAVKILAKQNKNRSYKKAFDSMIYELTMGETFSEAMKKQGSMFPALLINMVKAAEMIGDIESTLDEMSKYYDEMEKNRKSIISALTYPALIFVFAIAVIIFIMIYIVPQFQNVYAGLGTELNAYTQAIIDISAFISTNWRYMLLGLIGFIVIFTVVYRNVKSFKTGVQYIIMHLPVIGKIVIYNEMTTFSKTFASLNKNNVLLTDSIDILSKITNNEMYKMIMFDTISNLLRGDKMSESFKNNWAVPELAYYMISTGESTGQLAEMLDKVADYYQNEQKNMTEQLKAFIEPIMIIFLAVIVGGIILAIIIPMFEMYGSIS